MQLQYSSSSLERLKSFAQTQKVNEFWQIKWIREVIWQTGVIGLETASQLQAHKKREEKIYMNGMHQEPHLYLRWISPDGAVHISYAIISKPHPLVQNK